MAVNGQTIINESTLTTIADSIRKKTGESALMSPDEMVTQIEKIGKVKPFEWSWKHPIKNISVGADYVNDVTTYGDTLIYLSKGAETLTMTNITVADTLVKWLDLLPEGGDAEILVLAGLLSDDYKTALQEKGYTVVEGT